jgi:hypothetical protein
MANVNEVIDRQIDPMGHINPDVPPTTQKTNVFKTTTTQAHETGSRSSESDKAADEKDEKTGVHHYAGELENSEFNQEHTIADPFTPFEDLPDERRIIVTIRAMLVGSICGALVNASNIYLGLKTGWTFGELRSTLEPRDTH